jgi:hypothetical protein
MVFQVRAGYAVPRARSDSAAGWRSKRWDSVATARDDDLPWSVDVGDKHWTLFVVDARDDLGCLRLVQADDRRESVSSRQGLYRAAPCTI